MLAHSARSTARTLGPASHVRPGTSEGARADLRRGLVEMAPELFGRALRMSRSPSVAEDLVQDTVERAIRFESHYQPGTNLRAWVHQILFSVFVTRCRRSRRERNALDVLSTDPCAWTSQDAAAEMRALSPGVARALGSLPQSFRDVVVLVDLDELPYKDAAARLGVPVGTVMSRLHRGRKMLAAALRSAEGMGEGAAGAAPVAEAA
ncbi:MAG: sigma-70 family RNA polymerase sigma factor [Polyangiaceae bacterium]|nr:sigma-70 family RNA polymerase sigma factor [Polyangiaceae bacterium]